MIVDLIILGIVLLFVVIGYVRGLTGSILKIVSFFLAIILATVLFKPVSNLIINSTQIDEKISTSIRSLVIKEEQKEENNTEKQNENANANEEKTAVPEVIENYINETITNAKNSAKEAIVDVATQNITVLIVNAGTWIALFIVFRLILLLLKFVLGFLTELPVIKQIDKTGGVIYGLLEGIVVLYVIFAILSLISPMIANSSIMIAIKESIIGNIMYNNNLLIKLIF